MIVSIQSIFVVHINKTINKFIAELRIAAFIVYFDRRVRQKRVARETLALGQAKVKGFLILCCTSKCDSGVESAPRQLFWLVAACTLFLSSITTSHWRFRLGAHGMPFNYRGLN